MIMNHQIYMGEVILDTIKDELGEDKIIWYKDEQIRLGDNTCREIDYFLTANYLIEAMITANKLTIKKYNRSAIRRVDKEFDIKENNIILKNVKITFTNDSENEEYLFLARPSEMDSGDPKGFEKLSKCL